MKNIQPRINTDKHGLKTPIRVHPCPSVVKIPLAHLRAMEKHRAPGWLDAVHKVGRGLRTAPQESPTLEVPFQEYQRLWHKYNPYRRHWLINLLSALRHRKYGTAFGMVATPIARLFRMKCVDRKTGQLKPGSPCAKRKETLNKIRL
jgi:hypothetical protein